jgi:hypothetical protein
MGNERFEVVSAMRAMLLPCHDEKKAKDVGKVAIEVTSSNYISNTKSRSNT